MKDQEIIAAVATAVPAAIAVIRVSGKGCIDLIQPYLSRPLRPRYMTFCKIEDDAELLDESLVVSFPGPNSYTGEDMVELHLHGGPFIVQQVMGLLFRIGMRAAEPGEFTRRAFLNQKMDLTHAEGVKTLVDAQSRQEWVAAKGLVDGRLSRLIENLRSSLVSAMAHIEARIDFPDEEEPSSVGLETVLKDVQECQKRIEVLLKSYDSGRIASQGLKVALVGPPNAGKSTLLNHLLGSDRALVTDIAGTTRDFIQEACLVQGRKLQICDTAGLRETDDPIEKMGIEKSLEICGESDYVLFLHPQDDNTQTSYAYELLRNLKLKNPLIVVATKVDVQPSDLDLQISCHSGEGLDDLDQAFVDWVDRFVKPIENEAPFITSERHKAALNKSLMSLAACLNAANDGAYDEILAFELLEAARGLSSVLGDVETDDILDVIFSQFCIGK